MRLNLADVRMDLTQDVMLRPRQLPQLREQGVLPGGDAVHPPEADDPGARPRPVHPVRYRPVINAQSRPAAARLCMPLQEMEPRAVSGSTAVSAGGVHQ